MKLSEVILRMMESYIKSGDKNVEVCRFTDDGTKYYWATSAFEDKDIFVIGYHIDKSKRKL